MQEPQSDAPALFFEPSFHAPSYFRSHKSLPRRREELRDLLPTSELSKRVTYIEDNDTDSEDSREERTPLASTGALNGADIGLPPTPPSNSHDIQHPTSLSPPPHADGVVSSLMSKASSLSTPVNQRSPPTPDPSPPRTSESIALSERPLLFAYPSSRADSFKTAREDQSTEPSDSRSSTPLVDRLSTVNEERGLGLAFERDDDTTPTNRMVHTFADTIGVDEVKHDPPRKDNLATDAIPDREWDTNLMRNVTVRRRRNTKSSPQKNLDSSPPPSAAPATPATGSPRRSSSLRERIEASKTSPHTPSIENFAKSIGWPSDPPSSLRREKADDVESKRLSGSSMTSTVVEAMVIVTPPQRARTLRHSGKNLAYRLEGGSSTSSVNYSNRNSLHSDDVPLHRLVHKRASINRNKRISSESDTSGLDRNASPLSFRRRLQESAAHTRAHEDSVRNVLQPAAEIMSRSNSLSRPYQSQGTYHKRISSAPEAARKMELPQPKSRTLLELSPPQSPKPIERAPVQSPEESLSPVKTRHGLEGATVSSSGEREKNQDRLGVMGSVNINKSLPDLPAQSTSELTTQEDAQVHKTESIDEQYPPPPTTTYHDAVSEQPVEPPVVPAQPTDDPDRSTHERSKLGESAPVIRRGSLHLRGRSEERRRSSHSQDRTSTSIDTILRPSLDRIPTEELPRRSYEWRHLHSDDHRRVSFDRSTSRGSDEHAMARHLFAQTTPFSQFSQFSDTPIEVSEATAVSIYPHNNNSLLVVQQMSRASTFPLDGYEVPEDLHLPSSNPNTTEEASALLLDTRGSHDGADTKTSHLGQPGITIDPATPPMQIALPNANVVDSPLKNPRAAPPPPVIQFIPPTPAEELERQLDPTPPGPPKRSYSHPQRRLSFSARARRYSESLISPLLARANSARGRHVSDSHVESKPHHVPTVNDEEGTLHPFWRPRGFWDGFEDSDTESEDDDVLPRGGDTSDVPEPEPETPTRMASLSRRLTSSFKGPGGFLVGNSLGVERAGTNKRKPQIDLPSHFPARIPSLRKRVSRPKIMIQAPTFPLRTGSPRIEKQRSNGSIRSAGSARPRRTSRRDAWRSGRNIPGMRGRLQVQYIGLSGVKDRMRERKAEKRRAEIRRSIGSRYYVEDGPNVVV